MTGFSELMLMPGKRVATNKMQRKAASISVRIMIFGLFGSQTAVAFGDTSFVYVKAFEQD